MVPYKEGRRISVERYSFLKEYIFQEGDLNANKYRHSFYPISEREILEAENRIKMKFPAGLKDFYTEIGYGFLCNNDRQGFNRLMDPESVADFRLNEGIYEFNHISELYESEDHLAFFEVNEGTYLTIDLAQTNYKGTCPIYYFDTKIADSLEEFIKRMDETTDYFMVE